MNVKKILFILVFISSLVSVRIAAGNTEFGYGIYLYRRGDYSGAIIELQRFIYYNKHNPHTPYLQLLLSLSYAQSMQYNNALASLSGLITNLEKAPENEKDNNLLCESLFHRLNILFRQKRFSDFNVQKEEVYFTCPGFNKKLEDYINFMSAAAYIFNLEWENALRDLEKSEFNSEELKYLLENELTSVMNHKDKSPVLGGMLSVVPGLGHMYAGRFPDGFRSLLINAVFTTLTIFSLKEDMIILGGIFGTIEAVLYISNIYGGVNAVLQENARYIMQRRDYMLQNIPIPPLDVITVRKELDL